jgi:hypothetical protein
LRGHFGEVDKCIAPRNNVAIALHQILPVILRASSDKAGARPPAPAAASSA